MIKVEAIVDQIDLAVLRRTLEPARFNQLIQDAMARTFDEVKRRTPGSGRIRSMWELTTQMDGSGFIREAVIKNNFKDQKILRFLEFGTKAHRIFPGEKGYLMFFSRKLGHLIKIKAPNYVRHPGTSKTVPQGHQMIAAARQFLVEQMKQARVAALERMVEEWRQAAGRSTR